jgi:hypothetical protein
MAIFRGTGGSLDGLVESEVILLAISQGGTGSATAAGARTNLGLGTAAATDTSAYATAAQGAKADTAIQPGDLATVATTGDYDDLSNKPTVPTNLDSLTDVVITSATNGQSLQYNGTNWVNGSAGSGSVTSVDMTVPTGLAVSGNPITTSGTLALTLASGYSIPTTAKQTEWDTAYTDRLKWDGGSTGLTAATGRTSLGATTVGGNLFTLTNPSAVTFVRLNADNTVSALSASDFRTAIGAGTSSTTGTVTSVDMSVPTGLSVSGNPVTSSGTLAVTFSAGYSIPTTANQTNWSTAYSWGNHASAGYAADSAVVHNTGTETVAGAKTFSTSVTSPIITASTKFVSSYFDASGSGGGSLRNASGTAQIQWGGGGGNNVSIDVSTNLNGSNAQIDISPTGTGHVHIKPAGTGSLEIAPTNVGTMDNMTIGATTARAITGTTITATTYAGGNTSNWNTAYGWGNHASAGYLTSSSTLDASKLSGVVDGGTY